MQYIYTEVGERYTEMKLPADCFWWGWFMLINLNKENRGTRRCGDIKKKMKRICAKKEWLETMYIYKAKDGFKEGSKYFQTRMVKRRAALRRLPRFLSLHTLYCLFRPSTCFFLGRVGSRHITIIYVLEKKDLLTLEDVC